MMTQQNFEQTLRDFLHRQPFMPIVVELESGEQILIAEATLAFSDGFAGYLSPKFDLREFRCEEVRDIRLVTNEIAS
jgi:hypothetical protein